ncbi:MAG: hypothetical protein KBG48_31605 [Kofleriaceae bacterium]|nr:hypothetical protein [Kofleriaceae bacterium]MBP9171982.1 hypothetical protein [Kofleriaceae bacterium]MBP9860512.1 hypothetical protein [Kofleriaceae bacterium]
MVTTAGAPVHRGVALGLWAPLAEDVVPTAVAELAALGATDVALVVPWRAADVHAIEIAPGPVTPSDDAVGAAIEAARARGLAVTVFPILMLDKVAPGQWRGTLAPTDVDAFWTSYERFILHYAALAHRHGAAALLVGSELGSTEGWRDRWFHLIGRARRLFRGRLLYSANWDHYRQVSFWARLDGIGVTGYFELTTDDDASVATLAAAWRAARDPLVATARTLGKPLWLTEVGYVSRDGATRAPWDYLRKTRIDLEEQRRAYAALIEAWSGVPELAGLFAWEWSGAGGPTDGGYTPRGKPAACALAAWFGG